MKVTVGRTLFGVMLGVTGGLLLGLIARVLVESIIHTQYNSMYYVESGTVLPVLGVSLSGVVTGILVPLVNQRWLKLVAGAGAWMLGTALFLSMPRT